MNNTEECKPNCCNIISSHFQSKSYRQQWQASLSVASW